MGYSDYEIVDSSAILFDQCGSNIIMVFIDPFFIHAVALLFGFLLLTVLLEDEGVVHQVNLTRLF